MSELFIQEKWCPAIHCLLCVIGTGAYIMSLDLDCTSLFISLSGILLFIVLYLSEKQHMKNRYLQHTVWNNATV